MKLNRWKIFFISVSVITLLLVGYIKYHKMTINDIGLKALSWVKKVKGDAVDVNSVVQGIDAPTVKHDVWTTLLQKNVSEEGQVNYKGFIEDSTLFNKYLTKISNHPPAKNWSKEEQLAYWINVYNAFTIKLIIDNYPLKSIKDISTGLPMINSTWDIKFFKIGSIDFDLNTIEHEILRKKFNEPRIHFAINCASISCPKLRKEAYISEQLERQLEEQIFDFINHSDKNIITTNETKLSKIFDWFKRDFTKEKNLVDYISKYQPNIKQNNKIEYLEYDWSLNE